MRLRVLYCDEYYGYTLESWIREYSWLIERVVCEKVEVESVRAGSDLCSKGYPVYLEADGTIIVEGLPGEEGYLVEILHSLGKCRGSPGQ